MQAHTDGAQRDESQRTIDPAPQVVDEPTSTLSTGPGRDATAGPPGGAGATRPANGTSGGPLRLVRRIAIGIAGSLVLAVGLVLLVTPGPAFVVIPIGLGILAMEFDWARRWLDRVKQHVRNVMPKGEQKRRDGDHASQAR